MCDVCLIGGSFCLCVCGGVGFGKGGVDGLWL